MRKPGLVALVLVLTCTAAHAEPGMEDYASISEGYRTIEVLMTDATSVDPRAYELRSGRDGELVTALSVQTIIDRLDGVAIAFVIEGKLASAAEPLAALVQQFDSLGLAAVRPAWSRGIVVAYAAEATVLDVPLGELRGPALTSSPGSGDGRNLVAGLTAAVEQLERTDVARKLLIVIASGDDDSDDDSDELPRTLQELRMRMVLDQIQTRAIVYAPPGSPAGARMIGSLISHSLAASSADDIVARVRTSLSHLMMLRFVTFPEVDAEGDRVRWDGVRRELSVAVDGVEVIGDLDVVLPARESRSDTSSCWWWQLGLGAGLAALLLLAWRIRIGRIAEPDPSS